MSNLYRWTPTRKQAVVAEVLAGRDVRDAAAANAVPVHEIKEWLALYAARGVRGLYITKRAA